MDAVAALPDQAKGPSLPGAEGVSQASKNVFVCPETLAQKAPNYSVIFLVLSLAVWIVWCVALKKLRPELWERLTASCSGGPRNEANEGLTQQAKQGSAHGDLNLADAG
jgi:hypothetical protein